MTNLWPYLTEEKFAKSGAVNVNFVFNENNIYISDNHLCALWGWLQQCSPNEEYSFIHIDHHKDLKIPNLITNLKVNDNLSSQQKENILANLRTIDTAKMIDDFLAHRETYKNICIEPYLAYDTYIQIAYWIFPDWFSEMSFLTKECPYPDIFDKCRLIPASNGCDDFERTITDCKRMEFKDFCDVHKAIAGIAKNQCKHKVILNIDIDYFFDCDNGNTRDAYWTEDKIDSLVNLLKEALDSGNIQVLTIAMSPSCCGKGQIDGWKNSFDITRRFLSVLSASAKSEFIEKLEEKMP